MGDHPAGREFMSERTEALYRLVRIPAFYAWLQDLLGSRRASETLVERFIKPRAGSRILDVGCGPGSLRPYLGDVRYTGVDLNPAHIRAAKERGDPGDVYLVGNVVTDLSFEPESFDIILLIGVLHHIDDAAAGVLFHRLSELLDKDGRIIACDGVYVERQRLAAKLMLDLDSGQHVRDEKGYSALRGGAPLEAVVTVTNDLLRVPYDHNIMVLTRV